MDLILQGGKPRKKAPWKDHRGGRHPAGADGDPAHGSVLKRTVTPGTWLRAEHCGDFPGGEPTIDPGTDPGQT